MPAAETVAGRGRGRDLRGGELEDAVGKDAQFGRDEGLAVAGNLSVWNVESLAVAGNLRVVNSIRDMKPGCVGEGHEQFVAIGLHGLERRAHGIHRLVAIFAVQRPESEAFRRDFLVREMDGAFAANKGIFRQLQY